MTILARKDFKAIAIAVVSALITMLVAAFAGAYVRVSVLEARVAGLEKRMDYFHGESGK
jgi:hypothetical protein